MRDMNEDERKSTAAEMGGGRAGGSDRKRFYNNVATCCSLAEMQIHANVNLAKSSKVEIYIF